MNDELPKRKTIRLTKYDYSQAGYYFVTICTEGRAPVLRRGAHCAPEVFDQTKCGRTMCAPTLSRAVKAWKEAVTKRIGRSIWQKGYYDHIIRNEEDYQRIRQYIEDNPAKWAEDEYFCE